MKEQYTLISFSESVSCKKHSGSLLKCWTNNNDSSYDKDKDHDKTFNN